MNGAGLEGGDDRCRSVGHKVENGDAFHGDSVGSCGVVDDVLM